MSLRAKKPKLLSLKDAFEVEHARRELERRLRDEAERKQQAEDLANAEHLHEALRENAKFLADRALTADRRRYVVSLDHARFRIAAYFEAGKATVSLADKRAQPIAMPRREETAEGVEAALRLIAQFLVDEIR